MKKISIMITSYNLEDYIDESIASVVNQEMPCDWELLIGDDGSDDGTLSKIKDWQMRYPAHIRYFVNERPKTQVKDGYRAAKNRASLLEKASGDYLIYLDGDDCWLGNEKLKTQFAILEAKENCDCSCCAHNIEAYIVPEDRKYPWIPEDMPEQKMTLKQYWSYYYFHTNTLLFRKECKAMLLDSLYRDHLNDTFITFIVLQFGKVYYLDKLWARYNLTGTGLWTGHNKLYGRFRNTTLYDLECMIAPGLWYNNMRKHCGEILYLLKNYTVNDYPSVEPILRPLDSRIFRTTFLMVQKDKLSFYNWMKRFFLFIFAHLFRFSNYLQIKILKKHPKHG